MTVHTFEVRHIKEGLEQIKAELGASAVILGTKRRDDGTLEISAKGEKHLPPPPPEETRPANAPPQIIEHPALTHTIQSLQQSIHDLMTQVQGLESEVRHMRLSQELQPVWLPPPQREVPAGRRAKCRAAGISLGP